ADFPEAPIGIAQACSRPVRPAVTDPIERARRYLAAVPSAVAGEQGDAHTFRACCRLVRGFSLTDAEALALLPEWNARCRPPWSERALAAKLRSARRNGREPVGGLLDGDQ